jgi:anti-sigma factor RsiW
MNCHEVQENLSAYFDCELSEDARRTVDEHLAGCESCRCELRTFSGLSSLVTHAPPPAVPGDLWARVECELDAHANVTLPPWWARARRPYTRLLVLAAGLLIVVTGAAIWYGTSGSGQHLDAVPNLDRFANLLGRDPAAAQQTLLAAYHGEPVSADQAARKLGYMPVSLRSSPDGYRLHSAYLLDMPCCRCMQALYERSDGQIVAVFEKSPDQPLAFGDRPTICTQCNGQPCQLTQSDGRLVVSCQVADRQLAIVGAESMDEAQTLLTWLHENSRLGQKRS